jgi:uncharacterized membrane protein YhaH (DUF805 family)
MTRMNFKDAVVTCFKKYVDFSGRARRSEFWYFSLFTAIANVILSLIFGEASIVISLFSLAILLPSLSVSWRRMHDIGKGSAWNFIVLIPLVGWILVLVWCCKDSQAGSNRFGPNPKA